MILVTALTPNFDVYGVTLDDLPLASDHVDGLADVVALVVVAGVVHDQLALVTALQNLKMKNGI